MTEPLFKASAVAPTPPASVASSSDVAPVVDLGPHGKLVTHMARQGAAHANHHLTRRVAAAQGAGWSLLIAVAIVVAAVITLEVMSAGGWRAAAMSWLPPAQRQLQL